jgi:hypothetical protein
MRRIRNKHLGDTGDLRRSLRCRSALMSGHQHMDFAAYRRRSGNRIQHCRLDARVVVFSNDQYRHQITFASFLSFSASSATDLTSLPAPRFGGSTTFRVLSRGATSTPSASGVTVSSGFFFAFMMFGSVT